MKPRNDLLTHFRAQWRVTRALTRDLLESLSDAELLFTPSPALGCWWKQFRHVGRVQENYIDAISTGVVSFGFQGTTYAGGPSKTKLLSYLSALDERLESQLHAERWIDWFGEQKCLAEHLMCLAEHEVLHHGQWISYRAQYGGTFPASWSTWGL